MTREDFLKDIPGNLKKLRMEEGQNKRQLTDKIGLSMATLVALEAGKYETIRGTTLKKIYNYFKLEKAPAVSPSTGNTNPGPLVVELRRIANAGETLTRQFGRVLETLHKVNEHEAAIENLEAEVARLANGKM